MRSSRSLGRTARGRRGRELRLARVRTISASTRSRTRRLTSFCLPNLLSSRTLRLSTFPLALPSLAKTSESVLLQESLRPTPSNCQDDYDYPEHYREDMEQLKINKGHIDDEFRYSPPRRSYPVKKLGSGSFGFRAASSWLLSESPSCHQTRRLELLSQEMPDGVLNHQ